MKIMLTGAAGFLGSHVARLLVQAGNEVHAPVRPGSNLWRIKDILPRLHLFHADFLEMKNIQPIVARIRPELCLHIAWFMVPGKYLAARENIGMLQASLQMASLLADTGCARFVGVGTCFEYAFSDGCLTETSPTQPRSLYAASKLALSLVLERLNSITKMAALWVRPFYLYGPYESEQRLVPSVIRALLRAETAKLTRGEQVRDYLHVEDVASAIWAAAKSPLTGVLNISSATPTKVREMAMKIGEIIGRPDLLAFGALPYPPDEPMFVCADNRRLKENTDWTPRYDLETGLRQTIDWWRNHLSGEK